MNTALHQYAGTTERNGFFDLFMDDVIRENIRFPIPLHAIERAEGAEFFANVGVIDIAIDDVTDDIIRMQALTNPVGTGSQIEEICFFKKAYGFLRSNPPAIRSGF